MRDDKLTRMYRVWHKEEGRYIEANFSISPSGHLHKVCGDEDGVYEIELDTRVFSVERCTGMKDRNGKLIYENDRFKNGGLFWWVIWFRHSWYATAVNEHGSQGWARLEDFDSITILGNVHEEGKHD